MEELLFISFPGGAEWFVILLIAILLFGRKLPEVARAMGKSITEFKRGLHEIEEEIPQQSSSEEESEK